MEELTAKPAYLLYLLILVIALAAYTAAFQIAARIVLDDYETPPQAQTSRPL